MKKEIKEVFQRAIKAIRVPNPDELHGPSVIRATGNYAAPKAFTIRKAVKSGRCPIA